MDNFLVKKMLVSTTKLRGANKNLDFFEYRVQKCDITKKKLICEIIGFGTIFV